MSVTDPDPTNVELLGLDPDAIARQVAEHLHKLTAEVTSSELVYTPRGDRSFYKDLLSVQGYGASPGARQRLERHAEQTEQMSRERRARAERRLRAGGLELRVEPNRTDGQGGFFSPPAWLNELFATANRPGRVLADLVPKFPLPVGVSSVNLPIIGTGTSTLTDADGLAVSDVDITDQAGTSAVVPFAGQADVSLQLLEQSPPGAHLDWAIFQDLSEGYDADLEAQLFAGTNGSVTSIKSAQIPGILTLPGAITVPYTSATPTGSAMYPYFGRLAAQIGDSRGREPECFLMRTARWAWLATSEDSSGLPFAAYSPFYLGSTDDTPDPRGFVAGWPVFLSDAIPANLSGNPGAFTLGAGTQDAVICLRPSDMILLEGDPHTMVAREPLSAQLGVRIQMHGYAAAIIGRRPQGVAVLGGTGLTVQPGE